MDDLSRIPWDQNIKAKVVEAIFKATVQGPKALMEVYACHEKAISFLVLESPPAHMTATDWVQAKKEDPTINQVVTWMESQKLDIVKTNDEMSQELKHIWGNGGSCVCKKGFYIGVVMEPDETVVSYNL